MRFLSYTLFIIFFFSSLVNTQAQGLELQGVGGIDCSDNLFHLTFQVRSNDATTLDLGSFSIYFTFDDETMSYDSFNSLNFDGSDNCNAGAAAWGIPKHSHYGSAFNMNFVLKEGMGANSCPTLDNNWTDIVDITFNVTDFPQEADFAFINDFIHFNNHIPNDGTSAIPVVITSWHINNCLGDFDNDGIGDDTDNCPFVANPGQEDLNNNNIGDICEVGCDLEAYTGGDIIICENDFVTLAASGIGGTPPYTFEWSTGDMSDFVNITTDTDSSFYVSVTDSEGCIDIDTINVNISDMFVETALIILQTSPWSYLDTIYDGDVINFSDLPELYRLRTITEGTFESMSLDLNGPIVYNREDNSSRYDFWMPNSGGNVQLVPGTYTMNLTPYSQDDWIGISCMNTSLTFTVVSDCNIELGQDTSFCLGGSTILDATSDGVAPFDYIWSTGETTPTITAAPTEDTQYKVTVTDANGCSVVDFRNFEVHNSGVIDRLIILDLVSGMAYDTIEGGEVYVADDLPLSYTIAVDSDIDIEGSVIFDMTGEVNDGSTSNVVPHHLNGDGIPLNLPIGNYTVEATAYEGNNGTGESCSSVNYSFTVISCPRVEMEDELIFCTSISSSTVETITPIITGNSAPYYYNWSDGTNQDHIDIPQPLTTTMYYLSVTNDIPLCGTTEDSIEVFVSDIDITSIGLVDLDNSAALYKTMRDGDVYNIQDLPANYNIEAFVTGAVGSVYFYLSGDLADGDTENGSPYRYNGDNTPTALPVGNYTMTTNIYTLPSVQGPSCEEIVIDFEVVDCMMPPIAGTEKDVCESHSANIPTTNTWTDITDENGHVLASFKDPGTANLQNVTVEMMRSSDINTMDFPSGGAVKLLPRHFHLSSSNYASGVAFPEPISVRLYFTEEELARMNGSANGDYGLSNYTGSQLILSHYFGNNLDCDHSNNTMNDSNAEQPSFTYSSHSCNGHYIEFEISHFSEFILHEPMGLLPVELISFDGELVGKRTRLNWETAWEENVLMFEIEKSRNAASWEKIGFVHANNTASQYEAWDEETSFGNNYYRLRIIDLDGTFEYSNIAQIYLEQEIHSIGEITPNPIRNTDFRIPMTLMNGESVEIQISNSLGQIVKTLNRDLPKGEVSIEFNYRHFPSGIYWMNIQLGNKNYLRKFEIIR